MFSQSAKAVYLAAATASAGLDVQALEVRGDFRQGLRENSRAPASAAEWWTSHVVRVEGVTAIALGNGAFATARHVGAPKGASDLYRPRNQQGFGCDVILFRHPSYSQLPNLPIVEKRQDIPFKTQPLVVATPTKQGLTLPPTTVVFDGAYPDFGHVDRSQAELLLSTPLNGFTGGAIAERSDSGSSVFYYDQSKNSWQLAGILVARLEPSDPSAQTHRFAVAIDTSSAKGIGQQLIDYRDGKIRGGLADGEVWEWARYHRTGLVSAFGLVVGLSGLLCVRLALKSLRHRPEVSSESSHWGAIRQRY